MGTRSLTTIYDYNNTKLCCIYQQNDGYPDGVGKDLLSFINSGKLVNGIPFGTKETVFNGMGCFAAQLLARIKDGPGHVYIHQLNSDPEEYNYEIKPTGDLFNPGSIELFIEMHGKFVKFTNHYDSQGCPK